MFGELTFVLEGAVVTALGSENAFDGKTLELCPSGSSKTLTRDNSEEYIRLYLRAYTEQDALQFSVLYQSFEDVANRDIMAILTPTIAKRRICSSSIISLEAFKASTDFNFSGGPEIYDEKDKKEAKDLFWKMIEEISNEDRQLILKFMCGRTRL